MASLKKTVAEDLIVPAGFGRLMAGSVASMAVDSSLPGIAPVRARATRYQPPLPWQLPCREGSATAARRALALEPTDEPLTCWNHRRRPS